MFFEHFDHQGVYAAAHVRQKHENVRAIIGCGQRALDGVDLPANTLNAPELPSTRRVSLCCDERSEISDAVDTDSRYRIIALVWKWPARCDVKLVNGNVQLGNPLPKLPNRRFVHILVRFRSPQLG